MEEEFSDDRRSFRFWSGMILAAAAAVAVWFGCVLLMRPYRPPPMVAATPNEIKQLVAQVNGPARAIGFIKNIQVPSAHRLGDVGPPARKYGAVQALAALIATTNDPEAKQAAEVALKKIKR